MRALIAIDDTESSWDAVEFATDLLDDDDEAIVLNVTSADTPRTTGVDLLRSMGPSHYGLGVTVPPTIFRPEPIVTDPLEEPAERPMEAAEATVQAAASTVRPADTVTVVAVGDPADRIVDTAKEFDVDLIVVGTRDRGPVQRFFTGSVSRDVLEHAPCSVLVVR